jgi:hypothetical protein
MRRRRYGSAEICLDLSVLEKEPEKGAEGSHHQLRPTEALRGSMAKDEVGDVRGLQLMKTQRLIPKTLDEKATDEGAIVVDRRLCESAL